MINWNEFEVEKVINEETKFKHLCLKIKSKRSDDCAVILLDRIPFNSSDSLERLTEDFESIDQNDIYYRFKSSKRATEGKMIFPATAAHIKKYSQQTRRIVLETPEMHQTITRPHFRMLRESGQIGWIENILKDQSEMHRRIVDKKSPETGFIILPDYKWTDESNLSALYLLIIPRRTDLWSIRDLTGEHLPLLTDIRKELIESALIRYKYPDSSALLYHHLRVYFHYPPTYPHLHIHVTLADAQTSCAAGQAVLLDEVIDNLRNISSEYYKSIRTLSMEFGEQHELYQNLQHEKV